MPQGRKNAKKPQSSKQRKASTTGDSLTDEGRSSISQSKRKRVQITEVSEDTRERELSEESSAVQDMDAAAETSEMALSETEGVQDVGEGQKGARRVDDVVLVILSLATQKALNCVIGEHLFVDKTWCNITKKAVLEDLANQKEDSSFFPFAKDIEDYSEEEFLIGYTPFEEVENRFLFCVTVQGKMTILDRLFNLRSSYMQRITKLKSIRPGAWQSLGSEKEVEAANVHYERPLLSFEWLTKLSLRNTGQPTFSDMVAGVDKSTVVHCLPTTKSLKEVNLVVRKNQDVAVQAVKPTAKKCVQTIPQIPTNVAVQCVSQTDITEEAKKHARPITDDQLNSFLEKYREYLLKSLRYNELYDLYHDDYPTLSKMGTKFLAPPLDVYKQYQSFTDVGAIEGKLIVSVTWSTKYTGVFAVAYADEVPCKWKIVESDSDDTDFEDEKSDNYEATKAATKTKAEEGSGEGQWLDEEAAWRKERQDAQQISAFSKSQAKLQQLELARRDFGVSQASKDLQKLNQSGSQIGLPRVTATNEGELGKASFGMRKIRSKELFNPFVQIDRMDDYGVNLSSMKIKKEIFQKYKQERRGKKIKVVIDGEEDEEEKKKEKKKNGKGITRTGDGQSALRETPSLIAIWGSEESWEYGMSLREAVRRLHRHHKKVRKHIHRRIRPMFTPIQWPDSSLSTSHKMKEGLSEKGGLRVPTPGSSGSDESCSGSQLRRDQDSLSFQSRKLVEEYEEVIDEKEMKEEAEVLPMLVPNNPVLIWSFKDDLAPKLRLDCPYELSCIQFCPQNGNILAGATASGQVVIWDITGRLEAIENADSEHTEKNKHRKRLEDLMEWTKDVRTKRRVNVTAISNSAFSHRERCTDLKWIHPCIEINNQGFGNPVSPGNFSYQFITTSLCGTILFWDLKSAPIAKAKTRSAKPQKIFSQLYNSFPESPFAHLNNAWKPFLKIILPESAGSSEILTGLAVDQPPTKYAVISHSGQDGPEHMEDRCEYGLVHTPINGYSSQINIGTRCGDVGIIELTGVKPGTNELEFIQKWYDLAHDGPVTGVFQHPFFPQLTITAGGHIFALWHSKFEDYPIMWRRYRKVLVTACLWSTLRPSLFRIAREDGSVEIWDLLRQSNQCQRDIIVSGQILTTIAGGPLPLPRGLLGIADYNSTMRMFYIPWQYQVWTEEERLQMEAMIEKEPERLRRMHEWRKWFNETQVTKIENEEKHDEHYDKQESVDVETSRQEEARKKYNEEVFKWYMKRRGNYVTKFEMAAKERLELRERAHMLNTVMTRKKVDRQRMEKLMHPLVKLERQEAEREEKAQRRLQEADALFRAAVQKLFPNSNELDVCLKSINLEDDLSEVTIELETLFGVDSEQLQKQKVDELSQWNWEWDIHTDEFFEIHRSMRELFTTNPLVQRKFKWLKQKLLKQLVEESHPILIPKTRMDSFLDWKYKHREENLEKLKEIYGPKYDVFWDRDHTCRRLLERKQILTGIKEDAIEEDLTEEDRRLTDLEFMMDELAEKDSAEMRKDKSITRTTAELEDEPIKSVLEKMSAMTLEESTDELDLDEQVLLMTRQSGLLPILPSPTGLSWLSLDMQDDQASVEFDYKPEFDSTPHTFVSQQVKSVKQQKIVQQSVAIELYKEEESEEEEDLEDDAEQRTTVDSKQSAMGDSRQISVEEPQIKVEQGSSVLIDSDNQEIKDMFTKSDGIEGDEVTSQID